MTQLNANAQIQDSLRSYVGIDEALVHAFPLLIDQLEIANQQLGDGVDTLIGGFNYLAQTMAEIDPERLVGQVPDELINRISKLQRFTSDLIQIGEQIHASTVNEATERTNDANRKNLHRIVLRTLNMQQLAADVHTQASQIAKEIDTTQDELIHSQTPENQSLTMDLVKVFMHMQVEINKMVIAFQFQDRVSQIISSVINAMKDLADYIQEAGEQAKQEGTEIYVSLSEIIEHVERYYVSKEQYDLRGNHKDNTSDDIELF